MSAPRFYVREHSGYLTMANGGSGARPSTEVMVLDRDYGHVVMYSTYVRSGYGGYVQRNQAENKCRELNEWHEAAMRA